MLDALGDEYISQHITQAYRDYIEQTSYRLYMSNMAKGIASALTGSEIDTSWAEILHDLDSSMTPEKPQETEQEIKFRLLSKLNGKGES